MAVGRGFFLGGGRTVSGDSELAKSYQLEISSFRPFPKMEGIKKLMAYRKSSKFAKFPCFLNRIEKTFFFFDGHLSTHQKLRFHCDWTTQTHKECTIIHPSSPKSPVFVGFFYLDHLFLFPPG